MNNSSLTYFRFFLPDPPKLPTKEGGAELDISGAWKFSSDVNFDEGGQIKSPLKKKCSSHSRVSSINDSGIYDSHYSAGMQPTRSCGTNAVHHQRSSSALVETIRGGSGAASKHQRSKSFLLFHHPEEESQPQQPPLQIAPPIPPPKVGGSRAWHRSAANMDDGTYASPPSILMQLAKVSPDLLSSLNATMTTPLEDNTPSSTSRQVKMLSPVVKARAQRKEQFYHQKSYSMAENGACLATPKSSRIEPHYPPIHRHSASMLEQQQPESSSPHQLVFSKPLQPKRALGRRSSSAANYSRSVSMLDQTGPSERTVNFRLENLSSRQILHMSTSQLKQMNHQRSSSSPYEGFVM